MKLTLALLFGGIGAVAQAGLVASYDFQDFDSSVADAEVQAWFNDRLRPFLNG